MYQNILCRFRSSFTKIMGTTKNSHAHGFFNVKICGIPVFIPMWKVADP